MNTLGIICMVSIFISLGTVAVDFLYNFIMDLLDSHNKNFELVAYENQLLNKTVQIKRSNSFMAFLGNMDAESKHRLFLKMTTPVELLPTSKPKKLRDCLV